jgi:hypothetical protein
MRRFSVTNPLAIKRDPIDMDALPQSTLLDDVLAAEALAVSRGTLAVWRSTGRYNLPYVKIGRLVKYKVGDLIAFRERHRHTGNEGEL